MVWEAIFLFLYQNIIEISKYTSFNLWSFTPTSSSLDLNMLMYTPLFVMTPTVSPAPLYYRYYQLGQ